MCVELLIGVLTSLKRVLTASVSFTAAKVVIIRVETE